MKKLYITFLACFTILAVGAQDIHYTQFFNSPLTTNPALTGVYNGSYRIGAIYRNQWLAGVNNTSFFNSPFQTPSISFDMPFILKNNDAIGVGALVLYDNAGAGSISTFTAQVSGSYIKHFGPDGKHQLSAGLQIGFTQVRISSADQHFASQYNANEYNQNLSSGVGFVPNVIYVNLNVGLLYYGKLTDKISLYAGGTIFNTTVPKVNLVADQTKETLALRANVCGGMDFTLGKKFHILPSVMWQRQSVDNELNSGLGFGYDVNLHTNVTLGVYNRVNDLIDAYRQADAVIAYAAFQINGAKLAVSYDFTVSKFSDNNTAGTGGLEISFIYIGIINRLKDRDVMFCPRF